MAEAKLATFRIDEEQWAKFKDLAKKAKSNATNELTAFIQGCIDAGKVPSSVRIDEKLDDRIDDAIQAAIAPLMQEVADLKKPLPL